MITKEKGYSLSVLVITIAVMLILATTAIVTLKNLTKDREVTQFMSDLREVEQFVKEYYSTKNTLPIIYNDGLPASFNLTKEMETQEHANDKGEYFYIDLDKLGKINLYDDNRGYILNESSLNVYVTNPITYNASGDKGTKYYTLTDEILGINKTYGVTDKFQIVVAGNPITWVGSANLTVSIPDHDDVNNRWNFKYYEDGPITASQFKTLGTSFSYGEIIEIKANGIYSIYVEDEEGYAKVVNVIVTKIDEAAPTVSLSGGKVLVGDDETGIKKILYTVSGASPSFEKDLSNYEADYADYSNEYNAIINKYSGLTLGAAETAQKNEEISDLDIKYPQFQRNGTAFTDTQTNIILYVEDYAGNRSSLSGVSRKIIRDSNLY
ncbi:MAG: hypothetical protein IJ215_03225 [Clostridia bacterium]|nr:hypothetical protein [Clostridia bacterium]